MQIRCDAVSAEFEYSVRPFAPTRCPDDSVIVTDEPPDGAFGALVPPLDAHAVTRARTAAMETDKRIMMNLLRVHP